MGRNKKYTDEFYADAAQDLWNRMAKGGHYSKAQLLIKAGFEAEHKQHWAKLRRAAGRLGLAIEYGERGWHRGNGSAIVAEWDDRMKRQAKSMRSNIVGHLQKADGAQQAVAYLLEKEMDPFAAPVILRAYGAGLPEDVVRELASATRAMLPEMDRETRDKLMGTADQIAAIAGLLAAPEAPNG